MLLLQTERFDKLCIGRRVFALQVFEQAATFCNLFDQTAAGTKVLAVRLQVLGKLLDFGGQNGDLHLWRPGVRVVGAELFNELIFGGLIQHSLEMLSDHLSSGS